MIKYNDSFVDILVYLDCTNKNLRFSSLYVLVSNDVGAAKPQNQDPGPTIKFTRQPQPK